MEVSSGHREGGQRVQELDILLPKGPLMKSSGFAKPQPWLTLLFVCLFFQKPRWRQKPWCFFKVNNAKVKWEHCMSPPALPQVRPWLLEAW